MAHNQGKAWGEQGNRLPLSYPREPYRAWEHVILPVATWNVGSLAKWHVPNTTTSIVTSPILSLSFPRNLIHSISLWLYRVEQAFKFVTLSCNPLVARRYLATAFVSFHRLHSRGLRVGALNYPVKFVHFISIHFDSIFDLMTAGHAKYETRRALLVPALPVSSLVASFFFFLLPVPIPPIYLSLSLSAPANWLLAPSARYRWYLLTKFLASNKYVLFYTFFAPKTKVHCGL